MTTIPSPIRQLLGAQESQLDTLLELIADERHLLVRPELDANTRLAERKRDCLMELERLSQRLHELVGSPSRLGFDDIERHAHQGEAGLLMPLWLRLKDKLERCRLLNLANGRAINLANRALERNLRLLKGQSVDMEVYAANGKTQSLNAYRRSQSV